MPKGIYPRTSVVDRFWSKVRKTETCWLWQGTVDRRGYGHFAINSRPVKAHRFAYQLEHGQIPFDRIVMHSCDTPACVRGEHLSLGTASDNMRDSAVKGRHYQVRKTHCKQGHAFNEQNTRHNKSGQRSCRACDRIAARKRRS